MSKIGEWWKSLFGRDVVPNQAEHGHTSEVGYRPTMERRARLENPLSRWTTNTARWWPTSAAWTGRTGG